MTQKTAPIVIIGTGLAGYSLAREFRKLDTVTPLLLLSADDGHSYSKPMLSVGLTKGKSADDLSMADAGQMAQQLKASIRTFSKVEAIDTQAKTIYYEGVTQAYSKLVLATGAKVKRLNFPGADHPKVFSINDLMAYRAFRAQLDKNQSRQRVLIMGAGLIGCEFANDLLIAGHQVSIVDPNDSALSGLIPSFAGEALVAGLQAAGLDFLLASYVNKIKTQADGSLRARLNSGQDIDCDLVISAVGITPNIDLAHAAGLACNQGILCSRELGCSASDVYALGDCAEVDGKVMLYVLPLMAAAKALAKTLSGTATSVHYGVMPVVTKTPACPVVVYPPQSEQGNWQIEQQGLNISAQFVNSEGELQGFVLTGNCVSQKQVLAKQARPIHNAP